MAGTWLRTAGNARAHRPCLERQGALNASWMLIDQGVKTFAISSNRIAALDANGALYVKEEPINAPWTLVSTGVDANHFAVTDDMVVLWGTDLYVKQGRLDAPWRLVLNPVQSFEVSAGDHI